jgi:hypothetical protein
MAACGTGAAASESLFNRARRESGAPFEEGGRKMFGLSRSLMALLTSASFALAQSPGSHEGLSQHSGEWLRLLNDVPTSLIDHLRLFSGGETQEFERETLLPAPPSIPIELECSDVHSV